MEWIVDNYEQLGAAVLAFLAFLAIVASFTKTDADDKFIKRLIDIFTPKKKDVE